MKDQRIKGTKVALIAALSVVALSAAALVLPPSESPERVQTAQHVYLLPASAEVSRTQLPDGRILEIHGAQGFAYLVGDHTRKKIDLPKVRRFASSTVMPGGEVLIWGGIDAQGHVLSNGEWFEPLRDEFAPTGMLSLPARAGHSITLLSDGRLLMVGGWMSNGESATDTVLWVPMTSDLTRVADTEHLSRLLPRATLEPDGTVQVAGGVDGFGHALTRQAVYHPESGDDARFDALEKAGLPARATVVSANLDNVPLRGKLVLRLPSVADVHSVTNKTVTLLGPEGQVSAHVVAAEGGRLIFVQPREELYPTSRYTLFAKGITTTSGASIPFDAIGFTTGHAVVPGIALTPELEHAAKESKDANALPPIYVMAGGGHAFCDGNKPEPLCRKHSKIEDGAWFPGDDNVADATGGHWRVYHPHQSLPNTHALETMLPAGTTAIIGQVRQIDEKPVANVEISIGEQRVHTDAQGVFVLKDVSAGHQVLLVDGGSADHGSVQYGRFVVGADVREKHVQHLPYVMYLPRILARDEVSLPSSNDREVVITHPELPGLELHVPAGAVFKDRDGKILTHIAIVPTPVDHAPFPLPDNFPTYFTIQPSDAVVQGLTVEASKGVRVVYPNYGRAAPNMISAFWAYDPQLGWRIYGDGHITADAQHIAPDDGVAFVWMAGASAALSPAAPPNNSLACQTAVKGKPVDLESGLFFHEWKDLSVNDILPLILERGYNSQDSVSHMFGIGGNSNLGIHLYNADDFITPQLVLPCGQGLAFKQVSGINPQVGDAIGTVWEYTGSDSAFYGATLQFFDSTGLGEFWQINQKDGTQYRFQNGYNSQLEWIQDRFGNSLQFSYNGGLIEQVTSPSGRYLTLNYDASNRVTSAIDNSGRKVSYAYNSAGTLATVTYPDQTTEKYTYDSNNRMLTMQDRRGNTWVTNQYDANGRVAKQTYADNTYHQFAYTTNSSDIVTATTVTDPNGNEEQITFDPVSQLPATDTYGYGTPLAQTASYIRSPTGLVSSMTDALNRTTSYTYDDMGNVTNITQLVGTSTPLTTKLTYTSDYNQLASVTDPLGHVTQWSYTNGCLTGITDALSHTTTIQCNAAGQPISIQDALGHASTFGYQGYDLKSVADALGRTTSFVVDPLGRTVSARDPLGNMTLTQYDTNDRVVSVIDALNQTTSLAYDGNGNLLATTLPNTGVIQYTYDTRNRPITRIDAMKQSESWTYNGMSEVTSHTDRKNQLTQISYDALNRPSLVSYADGSGTQATYDAGNRLTELTDSLSGSLSWGYDGLDDVTTAVSPLGTVSYTYDAAGRRITMTPAAQALANYTYDNANRLTGITQGSETVQLAYDAANRRTMLKLPNGVTVNYGYDNANELTGMSYAQSSGTTIGNLAYGYDNDGRRETKTNSFNTDLLPTPSTHVPAIDLNDRETSFNGQTLTYDANGNLTFDGINTYTWNARNQLTEISQDGAAQLTYAYDAMGRRISKTVGSGTPTQYLYDGANAVQETVGSTINPILVGLGVDERFARNDTTGRTYFLTDAINSTIALTNSSGAIQNTYSYDPYGNTMQSGSGFTNPYQYTGREADTPGLYYYRARYYSPAMGGMISEDPAQFYGGQLSFYAYVGGNPINYIDPYGLAQVIANAPIWGPFAGQLTIGDTDGQWSVGFKIGIGAGYSLELDTSDQERPCGWDWGYNVSGKIGRIDGIDAEVNHSYTTGDTESAINFNDPLDTGKSYSMSVENGDINTFQPFQAQPPTYQWGEATFIGVGGSYTFGK